MQGIFRLYYLLLTIILLSISTTCFGAKSTLADREQQVDMLFSSITGIDAPGASVFVAKDGQILLAKGYGYANIEHHVPTTPETKMRLGSVTKSFTALAILQLQEAGKLNIDDPLIKYLPDPPRSEKITLRQLLSHTSGITTKAEILDFAPGTKINYSNTGFQVLGQVIEKVSGESYEDYLRAYILAPLGMKDTGMDHPEVILPHRANGYMWDEKQHAYLNAPFEDATGAGAAGGLYSTIEDLYHLDQALTAATLWKPETLTQAFTQTKIADGSTVVYGLGWMVKDYRGVREVGHGGDITGFNAWFSRYPDQHLTIIVLSNVGMRPAPSFAVANELAHNIADIYLEGNLSPKPATVEIHLNPEAMQAFVGVYRVSGRQEVIDAVGDLLTIELTDGKLIAFDKVNRAELVPESVSVLALQSDRSVKITFSDFINGKYNAGNVRLMGLVDMQMTRLPD